jgi:chromosome segregation ATPase
VLAHIDARIGELEGEVEELQAYSLLDRRRKALEYTLHSNELAKAESTLAEIEEGRCVHDRRGAGGCPQT